MTRLGSLIESYLDAHPELNKKQFAERAGVTPQSVSGWITGKTEMRQYPDREHIQGLADAMNLPYVEVLHAISEDLGHHVDAEQIRPDVAVAITSLSKLSPQRVRAVQQILASMVDEEH